MPPPPRPVVPQLMPPSQLSPSEAILWEIREVCQLLKQPNMTVTELAMHIGDVTYESESMGMVVRPASRYFSEAQVTRDQDLDGNWLPEVPDDVTLSLTESRQLPMSALESAFGKGKWYMIFDAPLARPMYFRWRSQPAGPIRCWIAAENDESNDYGHKKGVVTSVTIQRTTIK